MTAGHGMHFLGTGNDVRELAEQCEAARSNAARSSKQQCEMAQIWLYAADL